MNVVVPVDRFTAVQFRRVEVKLVPGRLRTARESRGKTLSEVAEQLGISPGAMHDLESGRRVGSAAQANQIADILGVALGRFCTLKEV